MPKNISAPPNSPDSSSSAALAKAQKGAACIASSFEGYSSHFHQITVRAKGHFEKRDWESGKDDAHSRLDLYTREVGECVEMLQSVLGDSLLDNDCWRAMRDAYHRGIVDYPAHEVAETFFNSITRRVFATVGINPEIEFLGRHAYFEVLDENRIFSVHRVDTSLADTVTSILSHSPIGVEFANIDADVEHICAMTTEEIGVPLHEATFEVLDPLFFRHKAAYIVGRIRVGETLTPFVLPVLHGEQGAYVDAALITSDAVSILFSFTRSHFQVDLTEHRQLVNFLRMLMPRKRVAELYTAIGFHKHGKTELYRAFMAHLSQSGDLFVEAPGARGLVMSVFTLPSFDLVFKIIRDSFEYPKSTSREAVMERYDFVFHHDRVGRLVDVEEFEQLTFERRRFHPALLEELQRVSKESVLVNDDQVIIKHLYASRRVRPLNLYIEEAPLDHAMEAVIDYGYCLKQLAAANIFPGDMLLKNLGVTRHGRVVLYDYDEIGVMTDYNFRRFPIARTPEQELAAEPWYYVAPNDIFPEELLTFIGLRGALRGAFLAHHADILTPEFWRGVQDRLLDGEMVDFYPYAPEHRFTSEAGES